MRAGGCQRGRQCTGSRQIHRGRVQSARRRLGPDTKKGGGPAYQLQWLRPLSKAGRPHNTSAPSGAHTHTHAGTHTHTHRYKHSYKHTDTRTHTHIHTHTCTRTHTPTQVGAHTYTGRHSFTRRLGLLKQGGRPHSLTTCAWPSAEAIKPPPARMAACAACAAHGAGAGSAWMGGLETEGEGRSWGG